ncbi:MAG TPA: Rrf2 family transcriptional regulator [Elusimicrobiota bacterium]|nr:Rrf2 family transcriptional regulator [Elusimicrobiota bacterium]
MKISTRTEYGLRCLLVLAKEPIGASLSISQIAKQEQLPKQYVQQILLRLSRSGFVRSIRGTQGGFTLAKTAKQISVGAVLRILEGIPFQNTCNHFNKRSNCGHLSGCGIRPVWEIISQRLWEALDHIYLDRLIADEKTVGQTLAVELPVLTSPGMPNQPPSAA